MCSSKSKFQGSTATATAVDHHIINMNGRPVLQPTCNVPVSPLLQRRNSLFKNNNNNKVISTPTPTPTPNAKVLVTPPVSPKLQSPVVIKRANHDPNGFNSIGDKEFTPRGSSKLVAKKSKKGSGSTGGGVVPPNSLAEASSPLKYASSFIVEAPGSIAAARREQVAIMQVQRKMKIAHYGRTNSDPIYVAYHDEEWGVPVHDDNLLFELLVLTGAQVGSDWTSVLKKRQGFRVAFSGFDPETVSKFSEKKISSIGADYDIEISLIRGVVDNANRILEIRKEFRSFDKYLWGFVNHKPISTQYKSCHKMPVKTSKSESISKDMVRRGFRLVGPTVIHSFMQATGLTNDHLTTCPRHLRCLALATSQLPTAAPAL
ncbi:hypothetical protein C3L33_06549, partial [Rhododendron williamsianum]